MCAVVSVVTPQWIKEVLASYQDDPAALSMLTKLSIDPTAVPNFTLVDGILKFKNRIWVGADVSLQNKLLAACHSSALGGHSRVPITYMRMKKLFAWKGMKSAVHQFVTSCLTCQQAKPDRSKLPGLLQPLEVPTQAWQIISLDFVERLPMSGHANCILVVIDSFTKYGHFLPLHHPFTATSVAKLFMNNVYRLHGLPSAIVSDRDRIFTSKFWSELFLLADVSLQLSSSYHPQSDGQTERLNQTMETFLRCFANACPSKWVEWIALAEYWYNSCFHSAINRSPFEALYGYAPKHFGIQPADAVQHTDLASWIQDRMVMTSLIKLHLTRSKDRMKRQADKKRSERVFAVGDMVFLKLRPYIQSSLAPRSNQKLAFKFFGPFEVIARVGQVAYKLKLPASSSIHPVFHVSQLKKMAPGTQVISNLPSDIDLPRVPVKILQRRVINRDLLSVPQVLVQWCEWPASMATWEDLESLQQRFPCAPAWGQAGLQEPGMLPASMGQDVAHGPAELTCVCMEMNGPSSSIACVHIVGLSPCKPFPAIDAEEAGEETISFINTTLTLHLSSSSRWPLWPTGIPGSCRFPFFDSCSSFSTTPLLTLV
jgi:hypothetical protein